MLILSFITCFASIAGSGPYTPAVL